MGSQKHCLRQAKECDRLAAEAKLKSDRRVLQSAAAMWRTLAAAYELFKGDAIIKIGELSRDLDRAGGGDRKSKFRTHGSLNGKAKALAEAGISTSAARRAEIRQAFSPDREGVRLKAEAGISTSAARRAEIRQAFSPDREGQSKKYQS